MTYDAIRLICFILLIFQLSLSNFAQTDPAATPRMPPPTPQQRMPVECEWSPNKIHPRLGIDYLEKNLALCRAANNKPAIARILMTIGYLYRFQRKPAEALTALQESLTISESMRDKAGVVSVLIEFGQIHQDFQGNIEKASEYLHKALALSEELGDKQKIALSLQYLGLFHQRQNNFDQAIAFYEKEIKLREELGDKLQLANVLTRTGQNYRYQQGDYSKALEYLLKASRLHEEMGIKIFLLSSLGTIGDIYQEQSYYSQALQFYGRSLKLNEELNNKFGIFGDLNRIARTYQAQGVYWKALEYYQRLLKLQEAFQQELQTGKQETAPESPYNGSENGFYLNNKDALPSQIASTLNNIGINYLDSGNYDSATENFQKSLQIIQNMSPPAAGINTNNTFERSASIAHSNRIIFTLRLLGLLNLRFGKFPLAIDYYQKTLPFCEQNVFNDPGIAQQCIAALSNIGYMYGLQGNYVKGLEYAERAANLYDKLGNSNRAFEPQWLLGDAYRVNGQLDKARQAFEKTISIFESNRAKIVEEEHRLNFIERTEKRPFDLYIDVLMQLHKQRPKEGFDALALQASERFRARLLVELLNESKAQIRQGVDAKLLVRERALQQQLNERAAQQTRLLSANYNAEKAAALQKEVDALTAEFNQTKARIRINSPRYSALTQPQPLSVTEIQRDLLDADTILLEYALGVERSYLWVVGSNSISSYELPNRAEIETDVRRVVGLLNNGQRWASDEKIKAEYFEASAPLSQKLLPPSLLSQLKGKRLVIVSDGALQYLPFGALPILMLSKAENKTVKAASVPLAIENEIVSLPSASVLAVLRRETLNRKQPAKGIAVFADPVFSENDERLSTVKADQSKVNQSPTKDLNRLLLERAFNWDGKPNETLSIPRLPFTRREAEGIFAAAPSLSSLKALDFEASRGNVLKRDLSDFRIMHFATHGLLNSEHPELSGIVLSLVNEQGQPVDGFLRLNEIYNLNLSAALVVLSACQTALGKEIKGEGLIGLTRGFMYAGSPRVVASLWKVDDVATAELMKLFYQKMLKEQMRPAAALRAAKIEMWKQKRWNAPFYWAAFEIQGEWR